MSLLRQQAEWMAAIAAGDEGVFRDVHRQHYPRLYRLAYGVLLNPGEVDDVLQEVFTRLHSVAGRWRPDATIDTWLYRVTLNEAISLRRRLLRRGRRWYLPPTPPNPEHQTAMAQTGRALREAMAALSHKERAVVTLFLDADMQPAEIAGHLGVTANAVRVTLHRATARMQQALQAKGVEWSNLVVADDDSVAMMPVEVES